MSNEDKKNRSQLPMPNTTRPTLITYDARDPDNKSPPIEQLRPPKGAPNVPIILIDDAGFGSSSGSACNWPSATQRRTPTTWCRRKMPCASRWRGNDQSPWRARRPCFRAREQRVVPSRSSAGDATHLAR